MKSYKAFDTEYRRHTILALLADLPEYSANDDVLQTALVDLGYQASHMDICKDLAWLEDQQMVTLRKVSSFSVATLTRTGGDVLAGRLTVPGITRGLAGRF